MASPDESWSDWVQINYVNLENRRVQPITYKFPQHILDEWEARARRARLGSLVVMMSKLRRDFYARTNRAKRDTRDN